MTLTIEDPSQVWMTSDLHLASDGNELGLATIRNAGRPFRGNGEARERLTLAARDAVGETRTLIVLGDLIEGDVTDSSVDVAIEGMPRHDTWLVRGNHDMGVPMRKWEEAFGKGRVYDYLEIVIPSIENDSHDGHPLRILCFHYPMMLWDGDRFGNVHLHGHTHLDKSYNRANSAMGVRRYDVGVDANGFRPVRLSEILDVMLETRPAMPWNRQWQESCDWPALGRPLRIQ